MIQRLRLKGFRRYVDETFNFERGVCFVSGRNNAGKTSLFLAIEYGLFGTAGGARTPAALMRPGTSSMGVELIFSGRDGKTYKLQRLHEKPPRSRTKVIGHFTLKRVDDGGEQYLLSSDFQDHEQVLQRRLLEITGITRRVFDLAVHVRQGEIAHILDGDSKLDIALGITAAGTANEEMRALALLDERASEALPALLASREHIAKQRANAASDESALRKEIERHRKVQAEQQKLISRDDTIEKLEAKVDELSELVDAYEYAIDNVARAQRALEAFAGVEMLAPSAIDPADERGDLRGRIRRATDELARNAPSCHCCGAPIDRAKLEGFVIEWQAALASIDDRVKNARALDGKKAAQAALDRAKAEAASAEAACRKVMSEKGSPRDALDARENALEEARVAHAAKSARAEALAEAARVAAEAAEARLEEHDERTASLEREAARLATVIENLEQRQARAEELRALAAAFKALQEELRTRAAHELAEATLRIHRAISVDDELSAVRIDPARYQVLVSARDHDVEVPATLAQGGGHRLLLGLAFRLALVKRLGPFPFVLLDEPTYGLDERNRAALLERVAGLNLCDQILLITHQHMGDVKGQQIHIERAA